MGEEEEDRDADTEAEEEEELKKKTEGPAEEQSYDGRRGGGHKFRPTPPPDGPNLCS